jgi:cobalt-zinc-cadmium efflux system membrane fusion protein
MRLFYQGWSLFRPIFIWTSFGAIAFWGHSTHWTFVFDAHSHSPHEVAAAFAGNEIQLASLAAKNKSGLIQWGSLQELKKSGIELGEASKTSVQETISALASVAYNGQRCAQLSSRTTGHVWQVYVRPGQTVKRGEVLAIVDSHIVGEAKSDWMQKRFTAIHLRRTYDRLKRVTQGALPEQRILAAESELKKADLDCYMAQQRLMNLGLVVPTLDDTELTPDQISEQIRYLGIPESLLNSFGQKPATSNLISISSPFDGTVVEQRGVVGEVVSTEQVMFVVADTRTMWLNLSIRREDAARLAIGQPVTFTAVGMKQPISTKIAWISSGIDPETRTVQAGCEVENKTLGSASEADIDFPLRANQFGNARIVVAEHSQAVVVPEAALQKMPDLREIVFVKVGTPAIFEPRVVKTGIRGNGHVQIIQGVRASEEIVSRGSFILKSEMLRSSLVGS